MGNKIYIGEIKMRKFIRSICITLSNLSVFQKGFRSKKNIPVSGIYNKDTMESLVSAPSKIPWYLRIFIKIADKKAKKKMIMGRILTWSPKISISSALLEVYVEKGSALCLETRMLTIIRILISYTVSSPFAIDINSHKYKKYNITDDELEGLRGKRDIESIMSFTEKEKVALKYAYALSKTPIVLKQKQLDDLRRLFSEKEIVAIAALSAKVNYWARLFEALRINPAGFSEDPNLHLNEYCTLTK